MRHCAHGCGVCDAPPCAMVPVSVDNLGQWWTCARCGESHVEKDCCEEAS